MHYRNGREAKNGDKIVKLNGGAVVAFGVLHSATPGNDYCNGSIAAIQLPNDYACMVDCIHVDDLASVLAEKGLDKRPDSKPTEQQNKISEIARVCHEVNRAYCQALGDESQPAWDDAPEWQRSSARMGVNLHTTGDFGPEASHISWMKQKLDEGWKYGPVKDPENKEHPCIVPFSELPREQQAKDFIFRAVVHALRG